MEKKELKESYNYIQKWLDGSNADNQHYDCLDKIYTMAIAKLKNNNGWISVEDRLPEEEGFYLVSSSYGRVVRQFSVYHNCWDDEQGDDYWCDAIGGKVTHWMPLPPPPKGE